jgi:carbon monoxide dehydrogenase subunit G
MQMFDSFGHRAVVAITTLLFASLPLDARPVDPSIDYQNRLVNGEIIVGMKNDGDTRLVTGTCVINESPDRVWPVIANPFEFKGTIEPRMKDVQVVVDKSDVSVLKVTLDMTCLYPNFNYTVESRYENGQRIFFHRVGGSLKDFKGSWEMSPFDGGKKTKLTYSMYIDPGFFVPQWIMREGVKGELPRTLKGLRSRVEAICHENRALQTHTLAAAYLTQHHDAITASSTHQESM